jgi:hypothetical protein
MRGSTNKQVAQISVRTALVFGCIAGLSLFYCMKQPLDMRVDASHEESILKHCAQMSNEYIEMIKQKVFEDRKIDMYSIAVAHKLAFRVIYLARSSPELLCREFGFSPERVRRLVESISLSVDPFTDVGVFGAILERDEFVNKLTEHLLDAINLWYGGHKSRLFARIPERRWLCITRAMTAVLQIKHNRLVDSAERRIYEILCRVGGLTRLDDQSVDEILRVIVEEDGLYEKRYKNRGGRSVCGLSEKNKVKWLRQRIVVLCDRLKDQVCGG